MANTNKLIVCLHDKDKNKPIITLENPDESYLKEMNENGYGIFETANSFSVSDNDLLKSGRKTKRQKEFLSKLNEVFADLDVCKDSDGMTEVERDIKKEKMRNALDLWCPPSVYVVTKNGLQPRWWLNEIDISEATQQKYINIICGIIEWSKMAGSKGDPVKDVTRILRKPGYYHCKSEPYLVTEEKGNGKMYTLDELKKYFWEEPVEKFIDTILPKINLPVPHSNDIDLLDIRIVVKDVWQEKGSIASFDKDDHLIIDGVMTASFVGRLGNGNYMATTSSDYPAKGNAVTYVAETLNISNKESWKWLREKYLFRSVGQVGNETEVAKYLPAISHSELISKEFPLARYTIEPFFEQGSMNMVSAPPNTWKSWLLFLFANNIAKGTAVFDEFKTKKTNVMIVNEEDPARLIQDRLRLLDVTDITLGIYYRIAQGSKLTVDFVDSLIVEAKEKEIGVIMFDSLRAIHDLNENDSKDMQEVMDLLKKIVREDITVIFTHHHRKKAMMGKSDDAESSRGSTAINAAVSGHISLDEKKNSDDNSKKIVIKHLKSKVGEKLDPIDIGIEIGPIIKFTYLGKHEEKSQAENEARVRILEALDGRKELLSRKDFMHLKVAGQTTIKHVLKLMEVEGVVKSISRKEAEKQGLTSLSEGKANECLYSLAVDGESTAVVSDLFAEQEDW